MTITEQLHFSILSAPIAAADRRALSQAWYSALYRADKKRMLQPRSAQFQAQRPATHVLPARPATAARSLPAIARPAAGRETPRPVVAAERRSPRLPLTRKIEQLVLQRQSKRAAATFVLDGTGARVRVLVSVEGGRTRLIAVCSERVKVAVSAALTQARYAAAARGGALHAGTVDEASC